MAVLRTKRLAFGEMPAPAAAEVGVRVPDFPTMQTSEIAYTCPSGMRGIARTIDITVAYSPLDPAPTDYRVEVDLKVSGGPNLPVWHYRLRDNDWTGEYRGQLVLDPGDQIFVAAFGSDLLAAWYHVSGAEMPLPA